MPPLLVDPVAVLHALASQPRRTLVALAGVPGAGKTTVAQQLAAAVNAAAGEPALIALGMDGFHHPRAVLAALPDPDHAFARRGAPFTFDATALAARLQAVRDGFQRGPVGWPAFAHEVGDPVADAVTVPPTARVVLVEGNYLLYEQEGWAPVRAAFDHRWYLDTPLELALERLAARHIAAWGFTRQQALDRIASNDGLNAVLIAATAAGAEARIGKGLPPDRGAGAAG
ncbi:MAG: hypothetical protein IT204_12690 [Fimbriimonadaceae bacterium]|nr:hypothetical protein [Fimbriimonadaceae bacterium]